MEYESLWSLKGSCIALTQKPAWNGVVQGWEGEDGREIFPQALAGDGGMGYGIVVLGSLCMFCTFFELPIVSMSLRLH